MGGMNLGPSFGAGGGADALFDLMVERRIRQMEEGRLALQERAQGLNEAYRRDALKQREDAAREAADTRAEGVALRRVALQAPGTQVPGEQAAEDAKYGLGSLYEPMVGPLRPDESRPAIFKGTAEQQQRIAEQQQQREALERAHERIDGSHLSPSAKQLAHAEVDMGKGLPASLFEDPAASDARAIRRQVEVHRQTRAIDEARPFRISPQDRLAAARAAKQDAAEWYKAQAGPSGKVIGPDGQPVSLADVEAHFRDEYLGLLEQGDSAATRPAGGPPRLSARQVAEGAAREAPGGPTPGQTRIRVFSDSAIKDEMRKVIAEARQAAGDSRSVTDADVDHALASPQNRTAVIARLREGR